MAFYPEDLFKLALEDACQAFEVVSLPQASIVLEG